MALRAACNAEHEIERMQVSAARIKGRTVVAVGGTSARISSWST
jgi:hypothetical protein